MPGYSASYRVECVPEGAAITAGARGSGAVSASAIPWLVASPAIAASARGVITMSFCLRFSLMPECSVARRRYTIRSLA
jgi:hypothetical protein